jgi:putative hydrolase of the HAD superfamily
MPLRHVEHWVFDLDNTLYSADLGVLRAIEQRICLFMQQELSLPREAAWTLQKDYYRDFGTTLSGLIGRHGIDPERYLDFVNDVDLAIHPDPALISGLTRLPGRRVIFTSNCGRHAERVLDKLGIAHLFDDVIDLRMTGFAAKPLAAAYDIAFGRSAFAPERAAMFDDRAVNLEIPARLGMKTVWLKTALSETAKPDYIHFETTQLSDFLHAIDFTGTP